MVMEIRNSMLEMLIPHSDQRNMQLSLSKAKRKVLLLQKCAATDQSLIGEHTEQGLSSVFLSLPLTLVDRSGFTIFAIGYLEKGACQVRETLKQGE
jgi:hypothetical protein